MPSISTIVVADAASTPVNHTFNKVKVIGDTAYFVEQSSSSALGYWALTMTNRAPLPGQTEKIYRSKISLVVPVVSSETINGIARPKLEYTLRSNVEHIIPAEATLQNRKDQRKLLVGIQNDTSFVSMVEDQLNVT